SGSSSDVNVVAGIEISIDGGATWKIADGTTNWSFTWTPTTQGTVTILVRGFDDSGNMETPGSVPSTNAITLNIGGPHCPCTAFQVADTADLTNSNDGSNGIEVGVKLRSAINGYITGLRFYKSSNDTGIHIGSFWALDGTLLARATFTNESATGWQEVHFASPVAVTANTTYVASYNSPTGYYSQTNPYFTTDHSNGPLTAIAKTHPDGPNGLYAYSSTPVFPSGNSQEENYWVDVIFNNTASDNIAPLVIANTPANNTSAVNINPTLSVTFDEAINPAALSNGSFELRDAANEIVPITSSYNHGLHRVLITPTVTLQHSTPYILTVKGGEFGVQDISGNILTSDFTSLFTTVDAVPLSPD